MPVTVAAADPDAWMRAPLVVGRAEDAATVDPMQLDGQSGDGSRGMPGIDAATVAPQLDMLFVARPAAVRPQCAPFPRVAVWRATAWNGARRGWRQGKQPNDGKIKEARRSSSKPLRWLVFRRAYRTGRVPRSKNFPSISMDFPALLAAGTDWQLSHERGRRSEENTSELQELMRDT